VDVVAVGTAQARTGLPVPVRETGAAEGIAVVEVDREPARVGKGGEAIARLLSEIQPVSPGDAAAQLADQVLRERRAQRHGARRLGLDDLAVVEGRRELTIAGVQMIR